MSNKVVSGCTPGGAREILGEVLPLDTPFLIQIFPVYACNFRCGYCLYALSKDKHGYVSNKTFMDMNVYKKCIDDIKHFNNKLKMLRFAGIGEPLLHKNIADMVRYAKGCNVAQTVDIVTNGALLNEELSLALIDAGLDKLRISIQGISKEKYKDLSNVDIDFNELEKNIRFFYNHRRGTKVHIKIIDCALSNEGEEEMFFNIFGNICDTIAIEHLTPTVDGIDYSSLAKGKIQEVTQSGNSIMDTSVCSQPFYMMQINPDGKVVPCCSMSYPVILGDSQENTIPDIWNGIEFSKFRRVLLDGVKNTCEICASCSLYKYGLFKEDILDPYVEQLKNLY